MDQMVGDEFHAAAISVSAEIGTLLRKIIEQASASRDRGAVAARVDHKVANRSLGACSAERAIERDMTCRFENGLEVQLVRYCECAEFDEGACGLTATGYFRGNGIGGIGVGQARHNHRRTGRDRARAINDGYSGKPKLAPARGVSVESDDCPAALYEVTGNGPAHNA
jgi:hypothetical protein